MIKASSIYRATLLFGASLVATLGLLASLYLTTGVANAQTQNEINGCAAQHGDNNQDFDDCVDGFGGSEGVGPSSSGSIVPGSQCNDGRSFFLGIPTWDRGIDCEDITSSSITEGGDDNPIRLIILNLTEAAAIVAGYVAVVFVVVGGFKFVLSDGSPDKAADARKTIINSLIGAGIAAMAAVIIEVIFNQVSK